MPTKQGDLFADAPSQQAQSDTRISLNGYGCLDYYPAWLDAEFAQRCFDRLYSELAWQQPEIFVYGQKRLIPRKQVWCGDAEAHMVYSGRRFAPEPWHPVLSQLRLRLQECGMGEYNSVLVNLYRDGGDSVSWHADDEPELGPKPVIASISLGSARKFSLKPKSKRLPNARYPIRHIRLYHGDLLVMSGDTQRYWHHAILKDTAVDSPRLNLTYRWVHPCR